MDKKTPLPLLLALGSLILVGCTNSNRDDTGTETTSESSIDLDINDLDYILDKYDEAGYQYSYSGEPCTITMTHWDSSGASVERAVIEAMLQGFEARYPDIKVILEIFPSYEETYGNNLVANKVTDVFLVPDGAFTSWAGFNKMVNLDPYIAASTLVTPEDMFPSVISRYQYNSAEQKAGSGVQLALPKDVGPYVMFYNKDHFDEMGVDYPPDDRIMTIDEAIDMWTALTKYDSDGNTSRYALGGIGPEGLVWSAGGDFLNETRDAFPTSESDLNGLRRGYQFLQDAYLTTKIMPPNEWTAGTDAETLFSMQRISTLVAGRWNVTSFRSLGFDWDVAYVPAFEVDPVKNMYSGSVGYAVFNGSQHIEAAWKLVEYIASPEGQEILSATGFQIPCYYELAKSEDVRAREADLFGYENYDVFVESAQNQSYGLWQYRSNIRWKTLGYDTVSERLFSTDPSTRYTVDEFLNVARTEVNKYL